MQKDFTITTEIKSCVDRIRKYTPLLHELENRGIDTETVAALFSYALSENERWHTVNQRRRKLNEQSKDLRKKVKKRHEIKPTGWHRDKMLHAYTVSAARLIFSKELIRRRTRTKTRPYIQRLAFLLYSVISQKTKRPYRLMAGLFHIFPELLSTDCRRGCKDYDNDQGVCKPRPNFFKCRKHDLMRHSIRQITLTAMKSYPPNMISRISLSEKEND